jgi:hypothetical protein
MRKLWNAFLVFIGGVSCMGHAEEQQLSKARVVAPFVFYCEDKDVGVIDEVLEPLQDVLKRTGCLRGKIRGYAQWLKHNF